MLVDSHCHLNYPQLKDRLDEVLAHAKEQGVVLFQTISTKRSDFDEVIALAERYAPVYASIGVHPHEAAEHEDITVQELISRAQHPKVIAIGETGLDYYYENSPIEAQKSCFLKHIEASQHTGLPLIVHTRDADDDTIDMLQRAYAQAPFKGLIHCFSTSKQLADKAIEIGFYISLSGILTFKKADELRETVASLPLERLLVETDSPYLAPMPHRGKPCEPAYTRLTAEKLAEVQNENFETIAQKTTQNFMTLFSKVPESAFAA